METVSGIKQAPKMKRINLDIDKLMKRIALTIGILVLIATPLEARIWETETQCVNRYGAPNERVLAKEFCLRSTRTHSSVSADTRCDVLERTGRRAISQTR